MKHETDRSGCSQGHRLKPSAYKDRNARIVVLFLNGVSVRALHERFGLTESRIGIILQEALGRYPCTRFKAGEAWGGRADD